MYINITHPGEPVSSLHLKNELGHFLKRGPINAPRLLTSWKSKKSSLENLHVDHTPFLALLLIERDQGPASHMNHQLASCVLAKAKPAPGCKFVLFKMLFENLLTLLKRYRESGCSQLSRRKDCWYQLGNSEEKGNSASAGPQQGELFHSSHGHHSQTLTGLLPAESLLSSSKCLSLSAVGSHTWAGGRAQQ